MWIITISYVDDEIHTGRRQPIGRRVAALFLRFAS